MLHAPRILALLLPALLLATSHAGAQDSLGPPSGTIRLETTSVAAGIGVSWGKGTLTVGDVERRIEVSGLSVVDVGVSRVTATGEVWGLDDLSKFDGTYYGVDLGVAVGGGGAGVAMRNQNGVFIRLRATQQGVRLSIATQGTTLKLE
jgi:hypothetical protein